ncbi:uncharacterized protein LOC135463065 [Liolophura sinensis]|uniref:uncharacterized protein LOC135463065 n=1 Tax=Liolophura sinensis TaxID=3198878 RepID=UPI003159867E
MQQRLLALSALLVGMVDVISGHGRLREPPGRSTMWRYGFNTTENFNDNELYCGGVTAQHQLNGGRCGICGDNYADPQPRANEAGGKYGQGVIVRHYRQGQTIQIHIELTARHLGWMEFKLCPTNDAKRIATQQCLDRNVLQRADGAGTKTFVDNEVRHYHLQYRLPAGLSCVQCVFQWRYHTGNSEGCDGDVCCVGCGPQEEFYGCADIEIRPLGPHRPYYPARLFDGRKRR